MKYIIIMRLEPKDSNTCWLHPILFQDDLVHAVVAQETQRILQTQFGRLQIQVVSAGFIDLTKLENFAPRTYGESTSLNIKSHPHDGYVVINTPQQYFTSDIERVYENKRIL